MGSKFYWYGSGGEILAETDGSGNTLSEYVYFGGRRVAVLPASGTPLYYGQDMLGTSRVMVKSDGTLCYDADFTPFGAERPYTSTCSSNYKFEGKERDTETQNDDFGARSYTWRTGRWLSADWSSVPVPVPYANLINPQTLNLYSMVSDDPESFADLDGHYLLDNSKKQTADGNPVCASGDPSECTSDDVAAAQTNQQGTQQAAQQTNANTIPFPTTIELPDVGKILTTALSTAADLLSSAVVESVGAAAYLVSPGTGGVTQEFPPAMTPVASHEPTNVSTPASTSQQGSVNTAPLVAEHTTGARPSTEQKHQEGQARRGKDRGGEKGDASRRPPRTRPDGWKGPWPPAPGKQWW